MIKSRLSWYLEKNKLLAENQSGFRPNRGTMDNIVRLENIVQSALIWIKGLIYKLHHLGINGHMLSWLKSFLTGRTAQVLLSGSRSELFSCLNGSPQGSAISPLLFITRMTSPPSTVNVSRECTQTTCSYG